MRNIIQTKAIKSLRPLILALALLFPMMTVEVSYAATATSNCNSAQGTTCNPSDPAASSTKCASVTNGNCDLINNYVNPLIDFLSALVGVAVVVSIIIGGIQYSSSGGDPSKVSAAKNRIRNSLIALVVFLFLFGLINFLVPGGIG
jgi:hypothetical protein